MAVIEVIPLVEIYGEVYVVVLIKEVLKPLLLSYTLIHYTPISQFINESIVNSEG